MIQINTNIVDFDYSWEFSFRDSGMGKNIITFGGDMGSSLHIDNENKDI